MEFLVDDEEVQNERDRGIEQRQKREFERELGVGSVDEDGGWSEMIEDNRADQRVWFQTNDNRRSTESDK
jgi:hypothetical protein